VEELGRSAGGRVEQKLHATIAKVTEDIEALSLQHRDRGDDGVPERGRW
jgi:hypothetical protein